MDLILGVLASGLTQLLKSKFGGGYMTMLLLAIISLAIAGVYVVFVDAGMWETVAKMLVIAGAVYSFVILPFEKKSV